MGRVRSRIEKLEDRRTVRHERREERDERGEGTAAVMVRVRSTLEGRAAEEDLAGRLRGHGGVVGLLGAEGGQEAVSSYRDLFFAAQGQGDVNEQGGSQ